MKEFDGNADGEYAERSTGGYNCVVNDAMINLYEMTKNKEYLSYPERNLHMMELYFEPDGTIFTQNSTRQDRGKRYGLIFIFISICIWQQEEMSKVSIAMNF